MNTVYTLCISTTEHICGELEHTLSKDMTNK